MDRRTFLGTVGAGACAVGTGCLGGGGEVIVSVQREVFVDPGTAWIEAEIPDVSDAGGAIQYLVRGDRPFDLYFFTDAADFADYEAYVTGGDPPSTPPGNPAYSMTALPTDGGEIYEAATTDGGARQKLTASGPYYFAVDHSSYRMETRVERFDDALTAFVDLTVIRERSPF